MRLEQLTIENFKCFKAKTSFDLGKITLLTGANSSGKSSAMHALLGALQTEDFPFQYSPNGHFVEMGDFDEMVYKGVDNFFVGMKFENDDVELLNHFFKQVKAVYYIYHTNWIKESNIISLPKLSSLTQLFNDSSYTHFELIENEKYLFTKNDEGNKISKEIELRDPLSEMFFLKQKIGSFVVKLNFIGSNRSSPQRTYYQQAKSNYKVGVNGENYLDQIYDWQLKEDEKLNELVSHLSQMKMLQNIKAVALGGGRFEIRLQTNDSDIENALSDVGFGVSQFMPILVADLQLPENSTLANIF